MTKDTETPAEFTREFLRRLDAKLDRVITSNSELNESVISVRTELNGLRGLRGDVLRVERGMANLEHEMDRAKTRLDLRD